MRTLREQSQTARHSRRIMRYEVQKMTKDANASEPKHRKTSLDKKEQRQRGREGGREAPVVSKDKERPKHCALRKPIQGPNKPAIDVSGGSGQTKHNCHIPSNEAHGLPGILHPAMLGNGSPNICQRERRRH